MALLKRFGHARYCQSLLILQVAETDIFAQEIGDIGNAKDRSALLSPDEGLSTMQNVALDTFTELRRRGSGRLQLVTEFDTHLVSEAPMKSLIHVYAKMLQVAADAASSRAKLGAYKGVIVGEVLNNHSNGSS